MPRPRSPHVIERAVKVYKLLEEQGGRMSTPELMRLAAERNVAASYSLLHHTLVVLESAGFIRHERIKGRAEWFIVKQASEEDIRSALASRR
ncbi:MAG TPA: hypothetical protein ENG30_02240 [Thermofilaceae archaeon]|nr:hypothetical protein [Thermofilaceae archaeon]